MVLIEEDAQQTRQLLGHVQCALGRKEQGRGEILGLGRLSGSRPATRRVQQQTLHGPAARFASLPISTKSYGFPQLDDDQNELRAEPLQVA